MNLTKDEERLLLYFEARSTDAAATIESARMNAEDFAIAKSWNESGFVLFGRIAFDDIRTIGGVARDHWCQLSDEAWRAAAAARKARAKRSAQASTLHRIGLPNAELCGGPSVPSERAPGSAAGGYEERTEQ